MIYNVEQFDKIVYVGDDVTKLTYGNTYSVEYSLTHDVNTYITLDGFKGVADVFYLKDFITKKEYRKIKLKKLKNL